MGTATLFIRNHWKIIVLIIIALLLFFYVRKNWQVIKRKLGGIFTPRDISFEPGEDVVITEARKKVLESIASKLYTDIEYTGWTGHDYTPYTEALALTDNELLYMATFYKRYQSGGNTLYSDIASQYYVTSSIPTQLMARLNKIGEGA